MVDGEPPESGLFPASVGERLRIAREAAGLDLSDIGTRTRIPMRHLDAIERSDYSSRPSPTYAVGFVKSYARALSLDEAALATDLRIEIGRIEPGAHDVQSYEPADPSRVPSRLLAWTAAAIALLIAIAYGVWRGNYFEQNTAPLVESVETATPAPTSPAAAAVPPLPGAATAAATGPGQVVLTATAPVWLRISDASDSKLFEKEMAAGESYSVPIGANGPKILTGRPDALKVTVDGREVAPLGPPEKTIADVGVSAAALAARPPVGQVPAAATQ